MTCHVTYPKLITTVLNSWKQCSWIHIRRQPPLVTSKHCLASPPCQGLHPTQLLKWYQHDRYLWHLIDVIQVMPKISREKWTTYRIKSSPPWSVPTTRRNPERCQDPTLPRWNHNIHPLHWTTCSSTHRTVTNYPFSVIPRVGLRTKTHVVSPLLVTLRIAHPLSQSICTVFHDQWAQRTDNEDVAHLRVLLPSPA